MRIEIDIPKEFEEHFKQDKFKDSFERIMADIKHSLENGDCLCAGRYEYETIEMLEEALENSKTAYDVDKVVNELKQAIQNGTIKIEVGNSKLFEIVKQGGVSDASDNVCEWIKYDYRTICPKNHDANNPYWRIPDNTDKLKYCPYCGKRIKIVGD